MGWRGAGTEAPIVDVGSVAPPFVREVPFVVRLEIVRELLGALEQATGAGQAHLMERASDVLRHAVLFADLQFTPAQRAAVAALMDGLDHESGRAAPRFTSFRQQGSRLVDLLERAASGSGAIRPTA